MTTEDRIGDLLIAWEDAYREGKDVPADELCQDCPELAGEVAQRIESLKRTAWLMRLSDNQPAALGAGNNRTAWARCWRAVPVLIGKSA